MLRAISPPIEAAATRGSNFMKQRKQLLCIAFLTGACLSSVIHAQDAVLSIETVLIKGGHT